MNDIVLDNITPNDTALDDIIINEITPNEAVLITTQEVITQEDGTIICFEDITIEDGGIRSGSYSAPDFLLGGALFIKEIQKDQIPEDRAYFSYRINAEGNVEPIQKVKSSEELLQEAKAARQNLVGNIVVVTQSGKSFNGDEVSQGRIARAIVALQAMNQPSTQWALSDNTIADVPVAELVEALALAGQEQTRIWMAPYQE